MLQKLPQRGSRILCLNIDCVRSQNMFLSLVELDTGYPRVSVEFTNLCTNALFDNVTHFNFADHP